MSSGEDEGFLLPAFVALWLLAGGGLQWAFAFARDAWARFSTRPSSLVTTASLLALAALPAGLLAGNFRTNDHHNRTFEIATSTRCSRCCRTRAPSSRTATS